MMPPIDVFFSYSHKDEQLRDALAVHLSGMKRQGLIHDWHDRKIGAGEEWRNAIDRNLTNARVILLLISADFIASDYCYDVEMQRALERHKRGEATVIPVILRPCDWHHSPVGALQALPKDAKPVTTWPSQDEAFTDVALGIRKELEKIVAVTKTPTAMSVPSGSGMVAASNDATASLSSDDRFSVVRVIKDPSQLLPAGIASALTLLQPIPISSPFREVAVIPFSIPVEILGDDIVHLAPVLQLRNQRGTDVFPILSMQETPTRAVEGIRWSVNGGPGYEHRFALGFDGSFVNREFIRETVHYAPQWGSAGVGIFTCLDRIIGALLVARRLAHRRPKFGFGRAWLVLTLVGVAGQRLIFDWEGDVRGTIFANYINPHQTLIRVGGYFDPRALTDADVQTFASRIVSGLAFYFGCDDKYDTIAREAKRIIGDISNADPVIE